MPGVNYMERSTAQTLIKVYACLIWFEALFLLIAALLVLFAGSLVGGAFGGAFVGMMPTMDDVMMNDALAAGGAIGVVMVIILLILLALVVAYVIIGRAIWRRERWGRIAAIVLSVLSLLSFPLGTLIGIGGIWLFGFDPTVKSLFGATSAAPVRRKKKR